MPTGRKASRGNKRRLTVRLQIPASQRTISTDRQLWVHMAIHSEIDENEIVANELALLRRPCGSSTPGVLVEPAPSAGALQIPGGIW